MPGREGVIGGLEVRYSASCRIALNRQVNDGPSLDVRIVAQLDLSSDDAERSPRYECS
jgi:hypothetical protein